MNLLKNFSFFVKKRFLLLEAAIVWTFAGMMLLFRGGVMLNASSGFSWLKIISCLGFGLIFFRLLFVRISLKHIVRITNMFGDYHLFWVFFSPKSYLMMLFMISFGLVLRASAIIPLASLSLSYITMGIPLLLSSFRFYHSWYYYLPVSDRRIN